MEGKVKKTILMVFMILFAGVILKPIDHEDPYIWLEEVSGAKPLEWVKARNAESVSILEKIKGDVEDLLKKYEIELIMPEIEE